MIDKGLILAALAGATALATPAAAQGRGGPAGEPVANQYICVFHKGAVTQGLVPMAAEGAARANGGRVLRVYAHTIHGFAVYMAPQALQRMQERNPGISYCVQDRAVQLAPGGKPGRPTPDPTPTPTPDPTPTPAPTGPAEKTPDGVTRVNGGVTYTGSNTLFVIDTGVDRHHPDLNIDPLDSRHAAFLRKGTPDDENGHGTHVSGTAAAIDNEIGVVGVAANAPIVSVRVLDRNGRGYCSDIVAGVNHFAKVGVPGDVANMSLGCGVYGPLDSAVLEAAKAGFKFAIAAGNDGRDADGSSPARVDHANIVTIAALNTSFTALTSWSNYGGHVDWAEPGSNVYSTWKDGGYNTISGTSMASPHAAGLLLLGTIKQGGTATSARDGLTYSIGVH